MTPKHSLALLALAALAAWQAGSPARASALPAPDGVHAVGRVRTEFIDPARTLDPADPGSGPRRLPAVVWYPAQGAAPAADAAYLAAEDAAVTVPALARLFRYAPDELQPLAAAALAVRPGAEPARGGEGFPVVVYSHGLFLYPEQNSALAARLASNGYIVVSIGHPGDSADLRLGDGRVVATRPVDGQDDPRFGEAWKVLAGGADLAARREALAVYAEALPATRIGRSLAEWRDDTLAVAAAIVDGQVPEAVRGVFAAADRQRLAFAGMSFGGATAATSCRLVAACRAAVNLDGQNFDPALYDQAVGRPLLLLLSDWPRYGLLEGQPRHADFSPNDLAYEPWRSAGQDPDVLRVRVQGTRHLGFTDLVALLDGPVRQQRAGDIAGTDALAAIGDLVLAFLEARLRQHGEAGVQRALERHPALVRHVPARVQRWAASTPQSSPGVATAGEAPAAAPGR